MVDRSDDAAINRLRFRPRFFSFFFLFFLRTERDYTGQRYTYNMYCSTALCCMLYEYRVESEWPHTWYIYFEQKSAYI